MNTNDSKPAVITQSGYRIHYKELSQQIKCCYKKYECADRGLILLVCDNSYENLVIYLSCLRYKIPVILLGEQDAEMVGKLLAAFPIAYLWTPDKHHGLSEMTPMGEYGKYTLFRNPDENVWRIPVSNEVALLLPTSGSEGRSKLVMLSYENIAHNTQSIIKALDIHSEDRAALMLPLCYSYGLSVVHTHLAAGGVLLLPDSPIISPEFWKFLEREKVTSLSGVPSGYELMRKLRILEGRYQFGHLRILTQAGGALRTDTQEYVLDRLSKINKSIHFAIMYGQTEATARMTTFYLDEHREKLGSVGRVIPGGKLWIEGDESTGEIYYEGNNVFLGYAETAGDIEKAAHNADKVLCTGDVGYLDSDGYLYVSGRKKRFAKVNGYRLGLDKLQAELSQQLGCEVVCVSVWIKEKEYVVVCLTDISVDESIVEKLLTGNRKLAGSYLLKTIEAFPYKENGKIDYGLLQKTCIMQER